MEERGGNLTTLARDLGLPYGTICCTVYGYRRNAEVQQAIASYLGLPRQEIFKDNGGLEVSIHQVDKNECVKK